MLRKFAILSLFLALTTCFNACGGDDDDPVAPGSKGDLTINSTGIDKILGTVCEIHETPSYLRGMALNATFVYGDEGMFDFNMTDPDITSYEELKKGYVLSDDIEIYRFYSTTGAYVGREDYEFLGGKATVENITSSAVVVRFSNFKFLRELGEREETFTVNGTISYAVNN